MVIADAWNTETNKNGKDGARLALRKTELKQMKKTDQIKTKHKRKVIKEAREEMGRNAGEGRTQRKTAASVADRS